jgi:ABC-type taurine transport system ATPase subunit
MSEKTILTVKNLSKAFDLNGKSLQRGMVFQEARLFPWMNVRENIKFGIPEEQLKSMGKREIRQSVDAMLRLVGLENFAYLERRTSDDGAGYARHRRGYFFGGPNHRHVQRAGNNQNDCSRKP